MKQIRFEIIALGLMIIVAAVALSTAQPRPATPPPAAPASGGIKVGYVDFQKLLDESVEGKKAQAALEKKFGEAKNLLTKKGQELKQLQEEIEKQKGALSESVLLEKKNLFEAKYKSYLQQKMMLQEQYNNEFVKLVSPMQKEINNIIQALGKEKGLTVIFKLDITARTEESQLAEYLFFPSAIAYADPSIDLTAEVLKRYDAAHK